MGYDQYEFKFVLISTDKQAKKVCETYTNVLGWKVVSVVLGENGVVTLKKYKP